VRQRTFAKAGLREAHGAMKFDFRLPSSAFAAFLALAAPSLSQEATQTPAPSAVSEQAPVEPASIQPAIASDVPEKQEAPTTEVVATPAAEPAQDSGPAVALETAPSPVVDAPAETAETPRPSADSVAPVIETAAPAEPVEAPASPAAPQSADVQAPVAPSADAPVAPAIESAVAPDLSPKAAEAPVPPPASPIQLALRAAIEQMRAAPIARPAAGQTPAAALRVEREEIAALYESRDFALLWIQGETFTPAARAAVARINRAREDGLDLSQYVPPTLDAVSPEAMARAELALSQATVGYARQASGVRVAPRSIGLITAKAEIAAPADALLRISSSPDAGEALASFNPPHQAYRELREKLVEVRRERPAVASQRIQSGPVLKIGMKDPRVPLVRARFGIDAAADGPESELVYDTRVASAVADFQRANGLPANGALTARTIAALSGGDPPRLEREILASMEMWRWAPRDMGATRIEVNITDYRSRLVRDGKVAHSMRVIVGKPETPTPVFSDTMRFMVVNPSWHVPQSIIRKQLAQDPNYYARNGYEVVRRGNNIFVRQPPGERNALGHIKFMFPNDHAVYMHDTPNRNLFNASRRAFSHGCVRVDQPFRFAEALMEETGWSEQRLRTLLGRGERAIQFKAAVPVHIMYYTAFVDDEGKLQLREDLYGYSRKVQAAIGI
jgi:murein L,D-transpeptidase YcbB/YkuD